MAEEPDTRLKEPRAPPSSPKRVADRFDPRLVNALTAIGFGLPVAGYFWFLERYSSNALVGDQWDQISMIKQSYVHFFPWGAMWAQHNENRIFFPNIILLLLVHTDHYNVQVEEYLGAVMLAAAVVFLLWAHKRRSPSTPWLYYCPVVFLAFSVVQYGNTIWGFQLAWYTVLLSLASAILLLDRVTLTWVTLVGALAVAVVGSFSSLQGLLIWPTGLVLLYYRRRSVQQVGAWIGVAIASTLLYFRGYQSQINNYFYLIAHPVSALKFILLALGDVVGKPIDGTWGYEDTLVMVFGLLIALLAVATLFICGVRRDEYSASPLGVALIRYGILFVFLVTQGRIFLGYSAASYSRYTTFDLLTVVGIYLALLGHRPNAIDADKLASSPAKLQPTSGRPNRRVAVGWLDRVAVPCACVVVLSAIVVQIPFGLYNGVQEARLNHAADVEAATTLRNINHVSDSELIRGVIAFKSATWIREQAETLEEHHLNVFANG